ncbi:hypothetical protein QWI17_16745 [Gilvimarinus sp. SDUM040013]|uniref:DUF6968 domain-containing protein n=1 Tax=Gilvimarinus gilvus TaxID=3058038 RepID=A0ABU4S6L9_9GAMM|nr:hypothetical protein [Gilvimarinus sp. SDUM040013]MDO3387493.1 hypothetical protein [Gilvimarinus sp. SDUM040013]MDX6851568.1 hypothetical protein [Gilvimarinus sp. SDUM040013]
MTLTSKFSEVVATRELVFVSNDGAKDAYLVSVAKPEKDDGGIDFLCAHEVMSENFHKVVKIHGIDTFQAIELSIKSIASYLEYLERKNGGKFYFLGESGHCFPK